MPTSKFDSLRREAQLSRVAFVRDIKSEVTALENNRVMVLTRLLDEWHDISCVLVVDESLHITDVAARMDRMPHDMCAEAEVAYDNLVGLYIFQRGIIKEIRERVERTEGCTHITEVVEASLRALFAGLYKVRSKADLSNVLDKEDRRQLNILRPVLADTCRSFRKADADQDRVFLALEKIRNAGYDPETLDPHRSSM